MKNEDFSSIPQVPGQRGWAQHDHEVKLSREANQAENTRLTLKLVALLLALLIGLSAWMFRWQAIELHPTGDRPTAAYLVNRWTGEIRYLQDNKWISVDQLN